MNKSCGSNVFQQAEALISSLISGLGNAVSTLHVNPILHNGSFLLFCPTDWTPATPTNTASYYPVSPARKLIKISVLNNCFGFTGGLWL